MASYASALAEVRGPDGSWNLVQNDAALDRLLENIFAPRDYEFYALLGLVSDEYPVEPIALRIEWPADTSVAARETPQGEDIFEGREWKYTASYHDETWVTLRELLQDERVMSLRGERLNRLATWSPDPDAMRILLAWRPRI